VLAAARRRFIDVGLELGGKDPAYVRPDADLAFAAENIVEGVLFNSGQSCCAVERIYVHEAVYDDFIERAIAECERWVVGDPSDPATWMGPMARARGAETVRRQVDAAMAAGLRLAVDVSHLHILRCSGRLSEAGERRVMDYTHIAELHVSDNDGRLDLHRPTSRESYGVGWARERTDAETPMIVESYLHTLDPSARKTLIERLQTP
jgi:hypothetical protein